MKQINSAYIQQVQKNSQKYNLQLTQFKIIEKNNNSINQSKHIIEDEYEVQSHRLSQDTRPNHRLLINSPMVQSTARSQQNMKQSQGLRIQTQLNNDLYDPNIVTPKTQRQLNSAVHKSTSKKKISILSKEIDINQRILNIVNVNKKVKQFVDNLDKQYYDHEYGKNNWAKSGGKVRPINRRDSCLTDSNQINFSRLLENREIKSFKINDSIQQNKQILDYFQKSQKERQVTKEKQEIQYQESKRKLQLNRHPKVHEVLINENIDKNVGKQKITKAVKNISNNRQIFNQLKICDMKKINTDLEVLNDNLRQEYILQNYKFGLQEIEAKYNTQNHKNNFYKNFKKLLKQNNNLNLDIFKEQITEQKDFLNLNDINQYIQEYKGQNRSNKLFDLIRFYPIFKELTKNQGKELILQSKYQEFEDDTTIFESGQNQIFIILSGNIQLCKNISLNDYDLIHVIDSKSDGDYFGDMSLIYDLFPMEIEVNKKSDKEIQLTEKDHNILKALQNSKNIFARTTEECHVLSIPSEIFLNTIYKGKFNKFKNDTIFLKTINLFENIPESYLIKFQPYLQTQYFNLGEVILKQGDSLKYLYIIKNGCVRLLFDESVDDQVYQMHGETYQTSKFDKMQYKKKFYIQTLAKGQYFGQRSILSLEDLDRKQQTFKNNLEIANLSVISDTPNLELIMITKKDIERLDEFQLIKNIMLQIIKNPEYDQYDLNEVGKAYLQWKKQNQIIEEAVRIKL